MNVVENITHPFMNALGWSILHSVWQFFLAALLCKLALTFAGKAKATTRHFISLITMVALPVTFGLTFARQYGIYSSAKKIVNIEFADAALFSASGENSFYVVENHLPAFLKIFEPYTSWVFWLYLTGLLIFSLHGMVDFYRVQLLRRRRTSPIPENWQRKVSGLCKNAGITRHPINVVLSGRVLVPVVIGVFKPMILLPFTMFTALSPEQIETILLHELRHIKNKDQYINLLQTLLEILFFYHPAMWWISKQLRSEREKRIDEWVVGKSPSPIVYAQALFTLETNRSGALQPALAATQSKNLLLTRIKNIMTMKTRRLNHGRNLAALSIIFAAILSLALYDPVSGVNSFGIPEPGYFSSSTYQNISSLDLLAMAPQEQAPDEPPKLVVNSDPKTVYLHDGSGIDWDDFSEEDRIELRKAMQEARLAMEEVNREVVALINSEEFRKNMNMVSQEVQKAVEEANREVYKEFNSEEFNREMQQVAEEVRKAMEDVNREVLEKINSEEFREEMQQVTEEVRRAIEEANREVYESFNSEEFHLEMQKASEEVRKALEELNNADWEAIGTEVGKAINETNRALEEIGPALEEALKELNIEEIMKEVMEALEKAAEAPVDTVEEPEEK